MEFMLVSIGMIALIVLVLVLLGNAYPGSGADLVDWKPTRSFEDEAQLELEDVQQMMDAQNEMRRRRGAGRADRRGPRPDGRRGRGGARPARGARARGRRRPRGRARGVGPAALATLQHGAGADRRLRLPRPGARRAAARGRLAGARLDAAIRRRRGAIAAAGIEAVVADPAVVGTVYDQLDGVTVVYWLLGSAAGPAEEVAALHGARLERLLEKLVDTPVRGFVYEACRAASRRRPAARGAAAGRRGGERWRIPVEVVDADPGDAERVGGRDGGRGGRGLTAARPSSARLLERCPAALPGVGLGRPRRLVLDRVGRLVELAGEQDEADHDRGDDRERAAVERRLLA